MGVLTTVSIDCALLHPLQLLKALKYLHSAGIIHRKIAPANVLLSEQCDVKVLRRVMFCNVWCRFDEQTPSRAVFMVWLQLADFGLARGVESADVDTSKAATRFALASPLLRKRTKHVVTRWYR